MALIKCTGCGHMVSDKAVKCPKCGTPIQIIKEGSKSIEREERAIAEVESPKVEIPKTNTADLIEEYEDEPQGQMWKKVLGILIFAVVVVGGLYLYSNHQDKVRMEKEVVLKAKADSTARVAAEQARQDSIEAVETIRQKFVRFTDVYINLSNSEKEHINMRLLDNLKERGYSVLKLEESSEYDEVAEQTVNTKHYYMGINMEYHGYWKATGSPCSGIEFLITDEPHASAIIHFENSDDLEAFLKDAEKAGFRKSDYGWSTESDYPYDNIKKIDDTTIECNSTMPY